MDRITPHLWFDTQAKDAAELYTSIFDRSEITTVRTIHDTPSGDCDIVSFTLDGQPFQAISAGPEFSFTPALSFLVSCGSTDEVELLWKKLSEGGQALMEIDTYPWSERYGWCNDRYGLSWQVMHTGDAPFTQKIVPSFMFVGDVCGKAEEAMGLYTSVFPNSAVGDVARYGPGHEPDEPDFVMHARFTLDGYAFTAMDSAADHRFNFNEAVSLMVSCEDQSQIDHYWESLSAVPEAEQCGWLKDPYGVSWQIVPRALDDMMRDADEDALGRVTQAFLQMKKFDLAKLEAAYAGR